MMGTTMSNKVERDELSGTDTTGHEWDGLKELDTPLPRWWLYIFYASIVISVVYWVLMPSWPLLNGYTRGVLGQSDRVNLATDMQGLDAARGPMFERLLNASVTDFAADPDLQAFASAAGEAVFGQNCRTCHGSGGAGAQGYPSLVDDVWIWGGTLADIEHTLAVGVRSTHPETRLSMMPAFGRDGLLAPEQINDVTEYVITLGPAAARLSPDATAAARGAEIYAVQCAACHGPTGGGDRMQGAPSLQDDIWLYGGSREEIHTQIVLGRGGVMPSWSGVLDPATLRAVAFYVHQLGGGEPDAPPPAPEPAVTEAAAAPAPATQGTP
jgi:cytochrome c oxidase cbb3-type subunit 3